MGLHNLTYRALRRLRIQAALNWTARLPDLGVSVPLLGDPLGIGIMLYAETWKADALRRIAGCSTVDLVLDVGANEGQTILDLARAGLGQVETLAFEPNPTCAYYLQKLIQRNAWRHVTLFPLALSGRACCIPLELESENNSGGSLIPLLRPGRAILHRQVVPCFSLDQLVQDGTVHVKPGFLLKIDVEGAELDVLRGATGVLRSSRPIVVCEVLWAHNEERLDFMRERNAALMELLRGAGYAVLRLVLSRDQRVISGLEAVEAFPSGVYSHQNAHECDYVFAPLELSATLARAFSTG